MPTGYGQLNAIADPATRHLVQHLFDLNQELEARVTALEAEALTRTAGVVAADARVTGVADPQAGADAVNLQTLKRYVAGQLGAFTQPPP